MELNTSFEEKELSVFSSLNKNIDLYQFDKYISVSNKEKYIQTIEKIKIITNNYNKFLKINEVTEDEFQVKQEKNSEWAFVNIDNNFFYINRNKKKEYNKFQEEISTLNIEKRKLFIIKESKTDDYKKAIIELYNHNILWESNPNKINTFLLKKLDLINKIYKCYLSKNEREYYSAINKYFHNWELSNHTYLFIIWFFTIVFILFWISDYFNLNMTNNSIVIISWILVAPIIYKIYPKLKK